MELGVSEQLRELKNVLVADRNAGELHRGDHTFVSNGAARRLETVKRACEPVCLLRRNAGAVENSDDLVDEFALTLRKLEGQLSSLQLRVNGAIDRRRIERPELLDNATKLADAQEHLVVLEVGDRHSSLAIPAGCERETVREPRHENEGAL